MPLAGRELPRRYDTSRHGSRDNSSTARFRGAGWYRPDSRRRRRRILKFPELGPLIGLLLPRENVVPVGEFRLQVLDVGQGLAVVVAQVWRIVAGG